MKELLAGGATPEGTSTYARELERRGITLAPNAFRLLGRTGWLVGKVGYGTYRVRPGVEEHLRTLLYAFLHGCNVVDTSTNYADGGSERLVGTALRELVESRGVARENIVVVTKAGYMHGSSYAFAQECERLGQPFSEVVRYADGIWHCIHPDWLENQLQQSQERTGLERLDVLLLHNPECFLGDAVRRRPETPLETIRAEFYGRLRRAFEAMERFVNEGRIAYYAISSNTFALSPERAEHVSLVEALRCAREAASRTLGDPYAHHFGVVQLPFNLLEAGALVEEITSDGRSFLDVVGEAGLGVLVNRPLNAIVGSEVVRLAEYAEEPNEEPPLQACARLASVEQEVVLALKEWSLWDDLRETATTPLFFDVAERLKGVLPRIDERLLWADILERAVAPSVVASAHLASERLPEAHREEWEALLSDYQRELVTFIYSATVHYNRIENERKAPRTRLLRSALGEECEGRTLSQIALNALASVPGVSTVLCGMKRDEYVVDGTALFARPNFSNPYTAFRVVADWWLVG